MNLGWSSLKERYYEHRPSFSGVASSKRSCEGQLALPDSSPGSGPSFSGSEDAVKKRLTCSSTDLTNTPSYPSDRNTTMEACDCNKDLRVGRWSVPSIASSGLLRTFRSTRAVGTEKQK